MMASSWGQTLWVVSNDEATWFRPICGWFLDYERYRKLFPEFTKVLMFWSMECKPHLSFALFSFNTCKCFPLQPTHGRNPSQGLNENVALVLGPGLSWKRLRIFSSKREDFKRYFKGFLWRKVISTGHVPARTACDLINQDRCKWGQIAAHSVHSLHH